MLLFNNYDQFIVHTKVLGRFITILCIKNTCIKKYTDIVLSADVLLKEVMIINLD